MTPTPEPTAAPTEQPENVENNKITVEATPAEDTYTVNASFRYLTVTDEELMAVVAVYDNDVLTGVKIKYIHPIADTAGKDEISITADEGCKIKGMLWTRQTNTPVAEKAEISIVK